MNIQYLSWYVTLSIAINSLAESIGYIGVVDMQAKITMFTVSDALELIDLFYSPESITLDNYLTIANELESIVIDSAISEPLRKEEVTLLTSVLKQLAERNN